MQPAGVTDTRSGSSEHREVHLRDLVAVIKRHWRIVVIVAGLVTGGAWFSSRDSVTQYQSNLTIQIASSKQVFARLDDIDVDELALKTDPILSEALVLTTQGLALRVVHRLGLQLDINDPTVSRAAVLSQVTVDSGAVPGDYQLELRGPAGWRLRDASGAVLGSGTYQEPATGPGFRFLVVPSAEPERHVGISLTLPEVAASWVRAGLSYQVRDGTNAVDIYFSGTDPVLIPRILNEAAVQLREDGARRALGIAQRKQTYIADQLERANINYQLKLDELQQYKERREIADLGAEAQTTVGTLQDLEQNRQRLLIQLATVDQAMGSDSTIGIETLNRLAAIENVGGNASLAFQIQNLLELYERRRELTAGTLGLRESNPQVEAMDQRITAAHAGLRSAVSATERTLRVQLEGIEGEIARVRTTLRAIPGMESRIAQIELEKNIQEQTTRYLLGQYESARMQVATIAPYITILDGASPAYGIGTSIKQKIILGFLVGTLLGLGAALFLEYLDQTIKSARDVERVLGIPVLGMIPHDPKISGGSQGRHRPIGVITALGPDDPMAESYRTLRTNVTFVSAEKPLQFIAMTSPAPREGKSTTAANLALTLAQGGHKTILIDGDLRRPLVHRTFALVQDPGLTDVLVGRAVTREAVRPEVAPNLDILPSGSSPPNPSELLGSDAMHTLIAELRREYEYIIIDTPPVLPVTDATVVAAATDATILTIRSGDTEETSARRALDQLRRINARVAGAVLNGVSTAKDRSYTYYTYQRNVPYASRSPRRSIKARIVDMF
ncbi:MAG TPA: polysaccharide biosynthesis tyrosine autokinase [Gemmatimonadales bacterium]